MSRMLTYGRLQSASAQSLHVLKLITTEAYMVPWADEKGETPSMMT
jgi:hypothetical protein